MAKFNVPDDVTVGEFFKHHFPSLYSQLIANVDLSALKGKEVTLQYDVDGKSYCIRIKKDGTAVDIIEGGVDKPLLHLTIDEQPWRDAVTGKLEGAIDMFMDPLEITDAFRVKTLMATKGALKIDLKGFDGNIIPISMVFNGESVPAVNVDLDLEDWISIQNKETTGQALVMSGKLKFTGDLFFLMKLHTLI
jgi:putative sterol carrier protein